MKNVSTIVFLLSLLAVFAPLSAVGQSQSENLQAYAYGSAIDLQGGFAAVPFTIKGEARTASGVSTGGESLLRYSYYFGRHFGIFASFSTDWTNLMGSDFFRTVNRADGQKYKYDPNSYDYMNVNLAAFIVGAGYRYDFGQWSLRPRIGIGYGSYYMDVFSYNRFRRDDPTNKPVHIEYEAGSKDYDYLVSTKGEISGQSSFVGFAGVQITYTIRRHFYFSAEVGFKCIARGEPNVIVREYDLKSAYNPENWSEAVGLNAYRDSFTYDRDTYRTSYSSVPATMFNVNIGIGWNIGKNRNVTGKYLKK